MSTAKKYLFSFFCIALFCSFIAENNDRTYYNYSIPIEQLIPQPTDKTKFSLLVQKSSYTLFVKYENKVIKSYPCVFGEDPIGDKRMQGDMKTPEGNFFITDVRDHSLWESFIEINYPNEDSWNKHYESKFNYEIPETATIGGDIGIHGIVDGWESYIDSKTNWTEGCVALKNKDVHELASIVVPGTPVKIVY